MKTFIPFRCSICQRLTTGTRNRSHPVNKGECCDECDCLVVIPARLRLSGMEDEAAKRQGEFDLKIRKKKDEDPDWFLTHNIGELI